jgi:hypothetical protein
MPPKNSHPAIETPHYMLIAMQILAEEERGRTTKNQQAGGLDR